MAGSGVLQAVCVLAVLSACAGASTSVGQVAGPSTPPGPTTANCTWTWFTQPLDHFSRGVPTGNATFRQRVCMHSSFWGGPNSPILFYVGNESPVDEYVNATGLMWNLAPKLGALIVFAEHRYFGESVPELDGVPDCMAFCTSAQALADYAVLIDHLKVEHASPDSAVVAFGGSYGGMLAAWIRMKYPNSVDGSIAASAPIVGFPLDRPPLDGSFRSISNAASLTAANDDQCRTNFRAAYVLLYDIAKTAAGRAAISKALNLCQPLGSLEDALGLVGHLQGPLFDLSEGNYPFPSDYITYALADSTIKLPPWPMRRVCEHVAPFSGVKVAGNVSAVNFTVTVGKLAVTAVWNQTSSNSYTIGDVEQSGVLNLLAGVAEGLNVWYNFTGTTKCNGATLEEGAQGASTASPRRPRQAHAAAPTPKVETGDGAGPSGSVCSFSGTVTPGMGWQAICCIEGLSLIQTSIKGVGNDMFWPPSVPRGTTEEDLINRPGSRSNSGCVDSFRAQGLTGIPSEADPWSSWLHTFYGGRNIGSHSNIVFSNGLYDPWSSAGVLENITGSPSLVALQLPHGGHHLDLMFPSPDDPADAIEARLIEEHHIRAWIAAKHQRVRARTEL